MALVIPELQIEKVLENGFEALPNDIDLLDDLLANYPEAMIDEAKEYLKEHKIDVVLNWPREGMTLPLVAVVNSGDSESPGQDVLGDFLHELEPSASDKNITEMRGIAKQGTYTIYCMAQDPRLALYISLFVESLLILNSVELQTAGMHNIVIGSGDLRFEEGMLPEWTNSRIVTLSCLHYHAIAVSEPILTKLVVTVVPRITPDDE